MNTRERVLNILHFKPVDRLPAVHFGYWNELLIEWAEQGHISMELARAYADNNAADRELDKILGWEFNWQSFAGAANSLFPSFPHKVIEELPDGFLRVQNSFGLIERVRQDAGSIPAEDDYQLKDRASYEELYKPKLQFTPERVDYDYFRNTYNGVDNDRPKGLHLGSVLGDIRNILSVVGMSYTIADDYDLFAEIIDDYAALQYKCTEEILSTGAKFDYAHYWEDICFKNGPLISPVMFDELCGHHYKKRNDLCRQHGIDIISLDCDGVIGRLIPTWFNSGVNTMFPIEIGVWGDQFEPARKEYGNGLLGVGAMDKTALRKDKAAVDAELERIIPLARLGGYIPCPDHRLMPGTKFELVQYYTDRIKGITL